ncbi:MAG: cytochrome c family protein [Candidatus Hydrogenedentota bacterium]|nr:MAG: cytochrome c family protein [Candidatus Hydrogenedentota bacterium]
MPHRKRTILIAGLLTFVLATAHVTGRLCAEEEKMEEQPAIERYSPVLGIATQRDPFFPSRIETVTGDVVSSEEFLSPERCKTCHSEIYGQWKGSMHSNSWNDPFFQALMKVASKETGGLTDKLCLGCHTPVGVISGEIPPVDASNLSEVASMGVFCDFCHTVSKTKGVGNVPAISEPGTVKRGPFEDSKSPFHRAEFSKLHTSPEFCGLCHNVSHPLSGLPIEQTYSEWLMGPYRSAGVPCQHCHMTPPDPPTAFTKNPGKACILGPEREHWWTHQFVGGNAFITDLLGSKAHSNHARNRLKSAAAVQIAPPPNVVMPGLLEFKVKVSNIGCGHYLPTGLTETREMWLDVSVTDADGKEVYRSGALDEHGEIDPDAVIYHTVVGDEDGRPTWKVWEAARVLYDYRIPPMGYRLEHYAAYVPADVKLPLTIHAILNYRSAPPHLVRILMGEEAVDVPIVEMTRAMALVE